MVDTEDLILIGKITGTHGIKGQVRVIPYSGDSSSILSLRSFFVRTHDGDYSPISFKSAFEHKKKVIVAVAGINDVTTALALVGCEVYVPRDQLPELPDGEYYWQDLLGLSVIDEQGKIFGKLTDILATGANDVYVVKDGEREYLIPAISEVVLSIDLDMCTMTVRPLEGLLDL
jgi:16S rRNA processing protein RimM